MPGRRTPTPDPTDPTVELPATTDADRERHIAGLGEDTAPTQRMTPLEGRVTGVAMVPARLSTTTDQRAADWAVQAARTAEHARFAAGLHADVAHTASLYDLLGRAGDATSDRELVTADLIAQLRSELEGWAKDREVNGS